MTTTRDLQVNVSDPTGKDITYNLKYANPSATDTQLDAAVKAINNLSQNTYVDTIVKDSYSLNEAIS